MPGPIFANVVLADEVNRATPRTQSALLEAMGEGQVTIEGVTRRLEKPFFVVATQNPAEFHGTYPLPESQLDRFILAAEMGPPTDDEAMEVLARREHGDPIGELRPVLSLQEVGELQEAALRVVAAPAIRAYIVSLLNAIRVRPEVLLPASMRAGLYLQRAAQAWALFAGRDFVLPDDIKRLVEPVLAHRLGMRGRAKARDDAGRRSLAQVPLPPLRQHWSPTTDPGSSEPSSSSSSSSTTRRTPRSCGSSCSRTGSPRSSSRPSSMRGGIAAFAPS